VENQSASVKAIFVSYASQDGEDLPRITQPVLMLNGKYDMYFPVETSQKPMFKLLGTAKDDKKMIVYDSGHVVPPTEFFQETLTWLDTYLGPVHE
jgi:eukaryotic-like serine/threonine-protein kinase